MVAAERGHEKIFIAVVVVIADGDAHAVADTLQSGFGGDIFKGAVRLLVVETIPVLSAGLLRDRSLGNKVRKRRSVYEVNVQATIVVVIEKCHAGAHRLQQILPGTVRGLMHEVDAGARCDVDKIGRHQL